MTTEDKRYFALRMTQELKIAAEAPPQAASRHREMAEIYACRLAAAAVPEPISMQLQMVAD